MTPMRSLAVTLSSLISQLALALILLPPPANSSSAVPDFNSLVLLIGHILSSSDAVAVAYFLSISRKRKRIENGGRGIFTKSPESFKLFFGMEPSTFEWLCGHLEPLLDCRDPVDAPPNLPVEIRLGIGLFRLSTGADFPEISSRFGVSDADSKFCAKHLCRVLCTNYRFWVSLPSASDLESISGRFESLAGLPNCCGVIGCARFRTHSGATVAAQIVVDSSSRITSIIAGFRGNKSDDAILKSSSLFDDVAQGFALNSPSRYTIDGVVIPQYFVGAGDYPLLPWLLVGFPDAQPGSEEENFNGAARRMGACWSRSVGSLRNWGIFGAGIEMEEKTLVGCIGACSILHNMLIMREDFSSFSHELDDDSGGGGASLTRRQEDLAGDSHALAIRRALCTRVLISGRNPGSG